MENLNYYKISHYEPYEDSEDIIVDCLMNGQNKPYEILLACNDYIVERED